MSLLNNDAGRVDSILRINCKTDSVLFFSRDLVLESEVDS